MTIVSKRQFGFTRISLYQPREPHVFHYLAEKSAFWIAVLSLFTFVAGNMIGQHGWNVFWKSVMGEGDDHLIAFTGTVSPVSRVPDYERWARLGGNVRQHTYRQVPQDLLIPLPVYKRHTPEDTGDPELRRVYFVEHLGGYDNGRGHGSHAGVDITMPEGTPILSTAAGRVVKVASDPAGFGNYVMIKHPNVPEGGGVTTLYSMYAHLSAVTITENTIVRKGEEIGYSGQTGFATAPHLHFGVQKEGAPMWLFTGAEAREAGMSFTEAVNRGLHRERGLELTLDPMLFVQAYQSYSAPAVAEASVGSAWSSSSVRTRAMSIAERKAARLAKLAVATTLVAFTDDVPVVPIPAASSSVAPPATPEPPVLGPVASIAIAYDKIYSKREWKTLTLTLLDADGNVIEKPADGDKYTLTTAYGDAEFDPPVLTARDFHNGVARAKMLPLGSRTVVVEIKPLGALGKPMRYVK